MVKGKKTTHSSIDKRSGGKSNSIRNTVGNAARSAARSTGKTVGANFRSITPNTYNTVTSTAEALRDAVVSTRKFIRSKAKTDNMLKTSSKKNDASKKFKKAIDDIINGTFEIRSGNDEFADDFSENIEESFDLDEFSSGFDDPADMSTEDVILHGNEGVARAVAQGTSAQLEGMEHAAGMIAKSTVASNQAMVASLSATLESGFASIAAPIMQMGEKLDNIGASIDALVEFNNENAVEYYSKSLELLETMNTSFENLEAYQSGREYKKYGGFDTSYGFNMKEYFSHLKQGYQDSAIPMILSMLLPNDRKHILSKLIPKSITEPFSKLDEKIPQYINELLIRLKDKADKNDILSTLGIGDIVGNSRESLRGVSLSGYTRDQMPWNGEAQKALVEVIPNYLASIEAKLGGTEERYYDYSKGKFTNKSKVMEDFLDDYQMNTNYGISQIISEVKGLMEAIGRDEDSTKNLIAGMSNDFNQFMSEKIDFNSLRKNFSTRMLAEGVDEKEYAKLAFNFTSNMTDVIDGMNRMMNEISTSQNVYRNLLNRDDKMMVNLKELHGDNKIRYDSDSVNKDVNKFILEYQKAVGWTNVDMLRDKEFTKKIYGLLYIEDDTERLAAIDAAMTEKYNRLTMKNRAIETISEKNATIGNAINTVRNTFSNVSVQASNLSREIADSLEAIIARYTLGGSAYTGDGGDLSVAELMNETMERTNEEVISTFELMKSRMDKDLPTGGVASLNDTLTNSLTFQNDKLTSMDASLSSIDSKLTPAVFALEKLHNVMVTAYTSQGIDVGGVLEYTKDVNARNANNASRIKNLRLDRDKAKENAGNDIDALNALLEIAENDALTAKNAEYDFYNSNSTKRDVKRSYKQMQSTRKTASESASNLRKSINERKEALKTQKNSLKAEITSVGIKTDELRVKMLEAEEASNRKPEDDSLLEKAYIAREKYEESANGLSSLNRDLRILDSQMKSFTGRLKTINKGADNIPDDYLFNMGSGSSSNYSQRNSQWKNIPIGRMPDGTVSTMGTGGCGPTALSAVRNQIMGYGLVTPGQVGKYASSNGYISQGGANGKLFTDGARGLGLNSKVLGNTNDLIYNLGMGRPAIIAGSSRSSKSPFSTGGHIVVANGIDRYGNTNILDTLDGSTKAYNVSGLSKDMYGAWGYGPKSKRDGDIPAVVSIDEIINSGNPMMTDEQAIAFLNSGGKSSSNTSHLGRVPTASEMREILSMSGPDIIGGENDTLKRYFENKDKAKGASSVDTSNDKAAEIIDKNIKKVNKLITDDDRTIGKKSTKDLDNEAKQIDKASEEVFDAPPDTDVTQSIINTNNATRFSMGVMVTKFQSFVGRLFGKEGFITKMILTPKNKERLDKVKSKLFTNKDAIFKDQYDAAKEFGEDTGKEAKSSLGKTYDTIYDNTMKYLYGENYEDDEKYKSNSFVKSMNRRQWEKNKRLRALKIARVDNDIYEDKYQEYYNLKTQDVSGLSKDEQFAVAGRIKEIETDFEKLSISVKTLGEAVAGDLDKNSNTKKKLFTKEFFSDMKKKSGKVLAGLGIGAAVGLANNQFSLLGSMFLPGGPVSGAIVGAGLSILTQTETFKRVMFGKLDEETGKREGGIISDKLKSTFKKSLPYLIGGAVIGGIKSVVMGAAGMNTGLGVLGMQVLPGGILGGAILGAGLSLVKNSETVNQLLFGKVDKDGNRDLTALGKGVEGFKATMAKVNPVFKRGAAGLGIGAITGLTLSSAGFLPAMFSMGGPVGMGVAGLALGIASSTKKFDEWMFGTKTVDENGKEIRNKDGFLTRSVNMIKTNVFEPMADKAKDTLADVGFWIKDAITFPFRTAMGSLVDSMGELKNDIVDVFKGIFEDVGAAIRKTFNTAFKWLFSPILKIIRGVGKGALGLAGATAKGALLPLALGAQGLKMMTGGLRDKQLRGFGKFYRGSFDREEALREKWSQDKEAGTDKGALGRTMDRLYATLGVGEVADHARAQYIEGNVSPDGDKSSFGWADVYRQKHQNRRDRKSYFQDSKKWKSIDAQRRRLIREYGGKEFELEDRDVKRIRKQFERRGMDADQLNSSQDIMDLLYRREKFKKGLLGEAESVDPITENPEQAAHREKEVGHMERVENYLEAIKDRLTQQTDVTKKTYKIDAQRLRILTGGKLSTEDIENGEVDDMSDAEIDSLHTDESERKETVSGFFDKVKGFFNKKKRDDREAAEGEEARSGTKGFMSNTLNALKSRLGLKTEDEEKKEEKTFWDKSKDMLKDFGGILLKGLGFVVGASVVSGLIGIISPGTLESINSTLQRFNEYMGVPGDSQMQRDASEFGASINAAIAPKLENLGNSIMTWIKEDLPVLIPSAIQFIMNGLVNTTKFIADNAHIIIDPMITAITNIAPVLVEIIAKSIPIILGSFLEMFGNILGIEGIPNLLGAGALGAGAYGLATLGKTSSNAVVRGVSRTVAGAVRGTAGAVWGGTKGIIRGSLVAGPLGGITGGISGTVGGGITGAWRGATSNTGAERITSARNWWNSRNATSASTSAVDDIVVSAADAGADASRAAANTIDDIAEATTRASNAADNAARVADEFANSLRINQYSNPVNAASSADDAVKSLVNNTASRAANTADKALINNIDNIATKTVDDMIKNAGGGSVSTAANFTNNLSDDALRMKNLGTNGLDFVGGKTVDLISDVSTTSTKTSAKVLGSSLDDLGIKAVKEGTEEALEVANKSMLDGFVKSASKSLDDLGSNKIVLEAVEKVGSKNGTAAFKTGLSTLKTKLGTIVSKLTPSKMKNAVRVISGRLAVATSKATAAVFTLGATDAIFAAVGGLIGIFDSGDVARTFGVREDDVDGKMRLINGVFGAIFSTTLGMIVELILWLISLATDVDYLSEWAMDLYMLFSDDTAETIAELRTSKDKVEIERQIYNAQAGTNYTYQEYLDLRNTSWLDSAWDTFTGTGQDFTKISEMADKVYNDSSLYTTSSDGKITVKTNASTIKNTNYDINAKLVNERLKDEAAWEAEEKEQALYESVGYGPKYKKILNSKYNISSPYAQGNSKWGNMVIGTNPDGTPSTMGTGGCGPTALSAVRNQLMGYGPVSPADMGAYAASNGYISQGGANAGLFTEGASRMGLRNHSIDGSKDLARNLASGRPTIISGQGNSGPFTDRGHIVVANGMDKNGNTNVLDPITGKSKKYGINSISRNTNAAWSYSKGYGPYGTTSALPYNPYTNNSTALLEQQYGSTTSSSSNDLAASLKNAYGLESTTSRALKSPSEIVAIENMLLDYIETNGITGDKDKAFMYRRQSSVGLNRYDSILALAEIVSNRSGIPIPEHDVYQLTTSTTVGDAGKSLISSALEMSMEPYMGKSFYADYMINKAIDANDTSALQYIRDNFDTVANGGEVEIISTGLQTKYPLAFSNVNNIKDLASKVSLENLPADSSTLEENPNITDTPEEFKAEFLAGNIFTQIAMLYRYMEAMWNSMMNGTDFWTEYGKLDAAAKGITISDSSGSSDIGSIVTGTSPSLQYLVDSPRNIQDELLGKTIPLIYQSESGGNYATIVKSDGTFDPVTQEFVANGGMTIGPFGAHGYNAYEYLKRLSQVDGVESADRTALQTYARKAYNSDTKKIGSVNDEEYNNLKSILTNSAYVDRFKKAADQHAIDYTNEQYRAKYSKLWDAGRIKDYRSITLLAEIGNTGSAQISGKPDSSEYSGNYSFSALWNGSDGDELTAVKDTLLNPEQFYGAREGYHSRIKKAYEAVKNISFKKSIPSGSTMKEEFAVPPVLQTDAISSSSATQSSTSSTPDLADDLTRMVSDANTSVGYGPSSGNTSDETNTGDDGYIPLPDVTGNSTSIATQSPSQISSETLDDSPMAPYTKLMSGVSDVMISQLAKYGISVPTGVSSGTQPAYGQNMSFSGGALSNGQYNIVSEGGTNNDDFVLTSLSGNDRDRTIAAALSQLGYYEKTNASDLKSFGANPGNKNYTKYMKEVYNSNGLAWCNAFTSWAGKAAGVDPSVYPNNMVGVAATKNWFNERGKYFDKANGTPQAGDIVFFRYPGNGGTGNHIGLVTGLSGQTLKTVEGNTGRGYVTEKEYDYMSSENVTGFARPEYNLNNNISVDPRQNLTLGYGPNNFAKIDSITEREFNNDFEKELLNEPSGFDFKSIGFGPGMKVDAGFTTKSTDEKLDSIFSVMLDWYSDSKQASSANIVNNTNVINDNRTNSISTGSGDVNAKLSTSKDSERLAKNHKSISNRVLAKKK